MRGRHFDRHAIGPVRVHAVLVLVRPARFRRLTDDAIARRREGGILFQAHGDAEKVHRILILGPAPQFANEFVVGPNVAGMMDHHLQKVILGGR